MPRKSKKNIPLEKVSEEIEEEKTQDTSTQNQKEKKQRSPREKKPKKPRPYSFITAFAEWRKQNEWSGLCPKKGSEQYDQIRKIYDENKKV